MGNERTGRSGWLQRVFGPDGDQRLQAEAAITELGERVETLIAEAERNRLEHEATVSRYDQEARRLQRERDTARSDLEAAAAQSEELASRLLEMSRQLELTDRERAVLERAMSTAFGTQARAALVLLARDNER